MTWHALLAGWSVAAAVVLLARGGRLVLARRPLLQMLGATAALTGVLLVAAAYVVVLPDVVIARELQLLMFDRGALLLPVQLFVIGLATLAALVWHVARLSAERTRRNELLPLLSVGLVVGTIAAARIRPLDPVGGNGIWIYDLLEPSLLLWLAVALTAAALTTLRIDRPGVRFAVQVAVVAGAVGAQRAIRTVTPLPLVSGEGFGDARWTFVWAVLVLAGLTLVFEPRLRRRLLPPRSGERPKEPPSDDRLLQVLPRQPAAVGKGEGASPQQLLELAIVMATPVALALALAYETLLGLPLIGCGILLVFLLEPDRAPSLLGLELVASSLLGLLFDPFGLGGVVSLALFSSGALLLLLTLERRHDERPGPQPAATASAGGRLQRALRGAGSRIGRLLSFRDFGVGVLKVAVVLLVVLVMTEIPFDDAIRIERFSIDPRSVADAAVDPEEIRSALLTELRRVRTQLSPRDFRSEASDRDGQDDLDGLLTVGAPSVVPYAPVGSPRRGFAEDPEFEAIGDGATLTVAGTDLPLSLLTEPLRRSLRNLFGVRSLRGHIVRRAQPCTAAVRPAAAVSGAAAMSGGCWTWTLYLKGSGIDPLVIEESDRSALVTRAARLLLAEVDSRPGAVPSAEAFKPFLAGVDAARDFALERDPAALVAGIEALERTLRLDGDFALGAYRLGRLYEAAREQERAERALRRAAADPDLALARNALAYHLAPFATGEYESARLDEATELWRGLVHDRGDPSLRSSAAAGLCHAVSLGNAGTPGVDRVRYWRDLLTAYFHCARSRQSFLRLRGRERSNATLIEPVASSIDALALTLYKLDEFYGRDFAAFRQGCGLGEEGVLVAREDGGLRSPTAALDGPFARSYLPHVVRYREQILRLTPRDLQQRCRYAAERGARRRSPLLPITLGDAALVQAREQVTAALELRESHTRRDLVTSVAELREGLRALEANAPAAGWGGILDGIRRRLRAREAALERIDAEIAQHYDRAAALYRELLAEAPRRVPVAFGLGFAVAGGRAVGSPATEGPTAPALFARALERLRVERGERMGSLSAPADDLAAALAVFDGDVEEAMNYAAVEIDLLLGQIALGGARPGRICHDLATVADWGTAVRLDRLATEPGWRLERYRSLAGSWERLLAVGIEQGCAGGAATALSGAAGREGISAPGR